MKKKGYESDHDLIQAMKKKAIYEKKKGYESDHDLIHDPFPILA